VDSADPDAWYRLVVSVDNGEDDQENKINEKDEGTKPSNPHEKTDRNACCCRRY